jgi:hypothetical protein
MRSTPIQDDDLEIDENDISLGLPSNDVIEIGDNDIFDGSIEFLSSEEDEEQPIDSEALCEPLCAVFRDKKRRLERNEREDVLHDKNELRRWYLKEKVKRKQANSLLKILRDFSPRTLLDLPKDIRTLLPSFRKVLEIKPILPGEFVYIGIKTTLELPDCEFFDEMNVKRSILRLTMHVDGAAAFRSGGKNFWPILGRINDGLIFIIGLYVGIKKPYDVNEFLRPVVDEICSFHQNKREGDEGDAYIELSGQRYEFVLDKILTDVPAKSYILCCKGHSGYYSCTRCKIKGKLSPKTRKVCFAGDYKANLRSVEDYFDVTWDLQSEEIDKLKKNCSFQLSEEKIHIDSSEIDDDYMNQEINVQEEYDFVALGIDDAYDDGYLLEESEEDVSYYQIANVDVSVKEFHKRRPELCRIPNFNPAVQVPLDFMHLALAGVCKRFIFWILEKVKSQAFVDSDSVQQISNLLKIIAKAYFPSEFQRKPEALEQYKNWKCTQFRDFLLYIGVVVLNDKVHQKPYLEQFNCLNACFRMMCKKCSPEEAKKDEKKKTAQVTRTIFEVLLTNFEKVYGPEFITHNVHNLLHLPDDFRQFGSLDNFSCFLFESYLKVLGDFVRSGNRPLQQVINKHLGMLFAQQYDKEKNLLPDMGLEYHEVPVVKKRSENVVLQGQLYLVYKILKHKNFAVRTDLIRDSYFAFGSEPYQYAKVIDILVHSESNEIYLRYHQYSKAHDLYTIPFPSSKVGVVICRQEDLKLQLSCQLFYDLQYMKCFAMPCGNSKTDLVLATYLHH